MPMTGLLVQLAALGLCLWLESAVPLFMDRPQRVTHGIRNIGIGLLNGFVLTLGFSGLVAASARWGELTAVGFLPRLNLADRSELLVGFLAFDLWMYLWHRANHALPLLWRFHRVHHSDPAVDSTSAYRFHLGEMVISTLLRLAVIPLLGISLKNLVLYELVLQPVILFHHSNIALPQRIDRWIRLALVSPNMHRVHHSDIPAETNSNYASIFSFWDRLGWTYRRRDVSSILYGLREFRDARWQSFRGLVFMPAAHP